MRLLLLLALFLPSRAIAADANPFAEDIRRLQEQRVDLKGKLNERTLLLSQASSSPEASRLLHKAVADTRKSLAVVAASLRKLREFGGMLSELKLKPKAVFGASWVQGDVTLITQDGISTLKAGTTIEGPGLIQTREGAANILLPDGTRLTLAPHTRFDTRNWTLYSGEIYYESLLLSAKRELKAKIEKKMRIRTQAGTCSIRGTRFRLTSTAIYLFDGEVELSTPTVPGASLVSEETPAPGSVVETGAGNSRTFALGDGLFAVLGPDSRLEISKSGKPAVFLRRGSARFQARKDAQVLVPNGRAKASGADWSMRVLPSGAAELSLEAGTVTMTAEEKRLNAETVDAWWDAPYEVDDED